MKGDKLREKELQSESYQPEKLLRRRLMAAKMVSLKMPAMTETERRDLERHTDTDFSDSPVLTGEHIGNVKRGYEIHPEWYKPTKSRVTIMIGDDVLAVLKAGVRGEQTRIKPFSEKKSWVPDHSVFSYASSDNAFKRCFPERSYSCFC